ncbi:MAG TPA: DUF4037 domain-containing protein [Chloroflexota bacterium]|nr:DUF4037 domain-containing protein [Chloroflexota bacterium]
MELELRRGVTYLLLSDEPWKGGIRRLVIGTAARQREIPFLSGALAGHHFFTGEWPPAPGAVDYEPQQAPATLTRLAQDTAVWHQGPTPATHVETRITYHLVGRGTVELTFETRSHATRYPFGYVGLFWATIVPQGGQRGFHTVIRGLDGALRWHYFQGGGDCWSCRANTLLGPGLPPAPHTPQHPPTYFFAEAPLRLALPIQVGRWRDLAYCLDVDSPAVAFTDVLLGTALGGPSWDVSWRLRPGERRTVRLRLTVGPWTGWTALEERYRSWSGCSDPAFTIEPPGPARETGRAGGALGRTPPPLAPPVAGDGAAVAPHPTLAQAERLFTSQGKTLLERVALLDRCAVACLGRMSHPTGHDPRTTPGRHEERGLRLAFLLSPDDWQRERSRLARALGAPVEAGRDTEGSGLPTVDQEGQTGPGAGGAASEDSLEGTWWEIWERAAFLRAITGLQRRPATDREWLPYLGRTSFLGRQWAERLWEAGQGRIFHDPQGQFTELWRHWTGYVPPDIHRALLARAIFRVGSAESQLERHGAQGQSDPLAFARCLTRFVDGVLELAFCWNEAFVPPAERRAAGFRRLPICPTGVRDGLDALVAGTTKGDRQRCRAISQRVTGAIEELLHDLYHLAPGATLPPTRPTSRPLISLAHAVRDQIADDQVRQATTLEW